MQWNVEQDEDAARFAVHYHRVNGDIESSHQLSNIKFTSAMFHEIASTAASFRYKEVTIKHRPKDNIFKRSLLKFLKSNPDGELLRTLISFFNVECFPELFRNNTLRLPPTSNAEQIRLKHEFIIEHNQSMCKIR